MEPSDRIPRYHGKFQSEELYSPRDLIKYMRQRGKEPGPVPETIILGWDKTLLDYVTGRWGSCGDWPFWTFSILDEARELGFIGGFGSGAPATATVLEEVIALGGHEVIGLGTAGAVSSTLEPGDVVLCTKALRDEGTSAHYTSSGNFSFPSTELNQKVAGALNDGETDFIRGPSWTTDAVYRETAAELRNYRKEGIVTVEMEASAIFSIGNYRDFKASCVFVVSDILSEDGWQPCFQDAERGLRQVFGCLRSNLRVDVS